MRRFQWLPGRGKRPLPGLPKRTGLYWSTLAFIYMLLMEDHGPTTGPD
jgi:hypothetical protein